MCKTLGRDLLFGLLKMSSWDAGNGEIEQKGRWEKLWREGVLGRKTYVGSGNILNKDEVKGLRVVLRRRDRRPELMAPAPAAAILWVLTVELSDAVLSAWMSLTGNTLFLEGHISNNLNTLIL